MKHITLFLVICLPMLFASCNPFNLVTESGRTTTKQKVASGLFAIQQNKKWGYIDRTGNVVIQPQFDDIKTRDFWFEYQSEFSEEGLACVKIGENWGYIDKTGKFVINPQYSAAGFFSEGLAWVKGSDDKYRFTDKTGKIIIPRSSDEPPPPAGSENPKVGDYPTQLSGAGNFSEGLAAVTISCGLNCSGGPTAYIDKAGKIIIIDPQLERAEPFSEGLAQVSVGNKRGYIDKTGQMVISPQFDFDRSSVGHFDDGLAVVKINNKSGYIDKTGKYVIKPEFNDADNFIDGLACVGIGVYPNNRYGFIDKTGKYVINPQFNAACVYAGAGGFSDGLAGVLIGDAKSGGKYGYIDKTGRVMITPQFDGVSQFSEGLARVKVGEKIGYIDKTGKYTWNPRD